MTLNPQQSVIVHNGFDDTRVAVYTCRDCGQYGNANKYIGLKPVLFQARLCFTCHFWTEKYRWAQAGDAAPALIDWRYPRGAQEPVTDTVPVVRIDGEHYTFQPDAQPGECRGHGGRAMTAIMHDGRVLTSRNVWSQGAIPERWRERLPDNAVWKPFEAVTGALDALAATLGSSQESTASVTES